MSKRLLSAFLIVVCIALLSPCVFAGDKNNKDRNLIVMTRNMDAGSDFGYILQAATDPTIPEDLRQYYVGFAVAATYQEMLDSNIPARADLLAAEIQATMPDIIGLQEITTLRIGPAGGPASIVTADSLKSLLAALEARGLHYAPVMVQINADVEVTGLTPDYSTFDARLTDFDALLARTDLPVSEFKLQNVQAQQFTAVLPFHVLDTTIPFLRGWIAADVKLRGKTYRFVTTHLETFYNPVQAAQAYELVNGPLNTSLPVVLAGDLNSDALTPTLEASPAYVILQSAGFTDVWHLLRPNQPGLTWPLFPEDNSGLTQPFQRIDLVFERGGGIAAHDISQTGVLPVDGAFASDHTGVVAGFTLLPH